MVLVQNTKSENHECIVSLMKDAHLGSLERFHWNLELGSSKVQMACTVIYGCQMDTYIGIKCGI